jgi:DNA-binding response OmpR family regulator
VSLTLWTLFLITTVKYVNFAMRMDYDGEGGIIALTTRAQGYGVPFIFITAFADETNRARALEPGEICFLSKPFAGSTSSLIAAFEGHPREEDTWAVSSI